MTMIVMEAIFNAVKIMTAVMFLLVCSTSISGMSSLSFRLYTCNGNPCHRAAITASLTTTTTQHIEDHDDTHNDVDDDPPAPRG